MSESKAQGKRKKERLLTAKEVQEILQINPMQLSRLVKSGKIHRIIPPLKKRGRYSSLEVARLKEEQEKFQDIYSL